jgi:polyisoprenoid-binding protein YceI
MSIVETHQTVVPEGTYSADPVHSSLSFEVPYMGVSVFAAAVKTFEAQLVDGRLSGSARIASLETKDENLHAHLMAPEFFDAERYPTVSFSSEEVSADGGEVVFEGEITIRGISQPATLRGTLVGPVSDPYGRTRYGLRLETAIDRTAFGILWNADMPDGSKALSELVTLKADLSLVKAS